MLHLIFEENSDLAGKVFYIPNGIRSHLEKTLSDYNASGADRSIDGYDRINNLLSGKNITYEELKRIKNFFDNYAGTKDSQTYVLNGGDIMKGWVNTTLGRATTAVKDNKQALSDAGMENAFRKPHTVDRGLNGGLDVKTAKIDTNDFSKKVADNTTVKFLEGRHVILTEEQYLALTQSK